MYFLPSIWSKLISLPHHREYCVTISGKLGCCPNGSVCNRPPPGPPPPPTCEKSGYAVCPGQDYCCRKLGHVSASAWLTSTVGQLLEPPAHATVTITEHAKEGPTLLLLTLLLLLLHLHHLHHLRPLTTPGRAPIPTGLGRRVPVAMIIRTSRPPLRIHRPHAQPHHQRRQRQAQEVAMTQIRY